MKKRWASFSPKMEIETGKERRKKITENPEEGGSMFLRKLVPAFTIKRSSLSH
jgi:hypothetical protein